MTVAHKAEVRLFDPRTLDRRLLKHPDKLKVRLPNRRTPFVPAESMVDYLVTMCHHAGLRVAVEDFLFYRHRRWIRGKLHGLRQERAKVTSGQLFMMYVELRRGGLPGLFLDILRECGYEPTTARPQMSLDLSPQTGHPVR